MPTKVTLTEKEKKDYVDHGYAGCPKCKDTEHIDATALFESDCNQAWHRYTCTKCGCTFEDIYTLTDVEIVE